MDKIIITWTENIYNVVTPSQSIMGGGLVGVSATLRYILTVVTDNNKALHLNVTFLMQLVKMFRFVYHKLLDIIINYKTNSLIAI